jgi:diguanylate cyclase (GGDEF)-like protein
MRRAHASLSELLERLLPVECLDDEGLALYRSLVASGDEGQLREGAVRLLERLSDLGCVQRLSRAEVAGGLRLRYRNLITLDTISITLPTRPVAEPPEPAARPVGGPAAGPPAAPTLPAPFLEAVAASSRRVDLTGALNHLYDHVRGAIGYDHLALFMSKGLSNSPAAGLSELEDVYRWPAEDRKSPLSLVAEVEATGETVSIPDMSSDPRVPEGGRNRASGSLVVAPLRAEAYVYGVLEVWSERAEAYDDDDVRLVAFVARFAAGLVKRRLEVEELIFVDQTSQIHNRRYFDEQLSREIERCKRTGLPMALLIADIDGFKQVNDTMGHAAGDSILKQVGRLLSENARQLDIVARYGGEEFGIILPDVTRETAHAVAERMRSTVATHEFVTGTSFRPTCAITVSLGGALYPLDAQSRDDLIDKADRIALYEAKRQGKNRVIFWKDTESE